MESKLLPCRDGNRHPDWDKLYRERDFKELPWHTQDLDPDLDRELGRKRVSNGRFLDIGAGVGTHALKLSEMGFVVTATDLSESAVETARKLAKGSRFAPKFVVDDITDTRLDGPFEYIFDRGCLHSLPQEKHEDYVQCVKKLLAPKGLFFLKCLSFEEPPRDFGPLRFSLNRMIRLFGEDFRILRLIHTEFQGSTPYRPKAIFVTMTSKEINL